VSFLRSLSKKSTQAYSILFFSTLFLVLHQYVKDRFFLCILLAPVRRPHWASFQKRVQR